MSGSPVKLHNPLAVRRHLAALAAAEGEGTGVPAATALSQAPTKQARRGLERILASGKSVESRKMAAWALGFVGDDQATAALVRALNDRTEDTDVRIYAAEALGHLQPERGHDEALAALLHALTDREPQIRFWAAFALGNLGDERAIPALQRLAERDSEVVPGWWSIQREALESIDQIKLIKGTPEGMADANKA